MALTKKQRECAHPTTHVQLTIDERYESCRLCGLIRTAPIPAPWIVAYDAVQPTPPPPALFADYTSEEVTPAPRRTAARARRR